MNEALLVEEGNIVTFQGGQYRENGLGLCLPFPSQCLLFPAFIDWSVKGTTVFTSGQKLKTSAHSAEFRLNSYSATINSLKQELNFQYWTRHLKSCFCEGLEPPSDVFGDWCQLPESARRSSPQWDSIVPFLADLPCFSILKDRCSAFPNTELADWLFPKILIPKSLLYH